MKSIFWLVLTTWVSLFSNLEILAAEPRATERDGKVMETLLLKVLADPELDLISKNDKSRTNVLLVCLTPPKFEITGKSQIESDTHQKVPLKELENLEIRNRIPKTYDTLRASYQNLKLSPPIQIIEVQNRESLSRAEFEKNFPEARAWVEAFLPGYSQDGATAFVRGLVGPAADGATVTAFLKKNGDDWEIVWHKIAVRL
jgi:hypothetical protein